MEPDLAMGWMRRSDRRRAAPGGGPLILALGLGLAAMAIGPGCSRTSYRMAADRQSYGIIQERELNPTWNTPPRAVEADARTRIGDPIDPDRAPIPIDEPTARRFQVSAGWPHEFHGWRKRGLTPIEHKDWLKWLPRDEKGEVILGRDTVLPLGLGNSREYQTQVEDVYLAALALTLARFEFQAHGFFASRNFFNFFGARANQLNDFTTTNNGGFSQNFVTGAQLLVDLSNTLVWDFSKGLNAASSALIVNASQPLLRGAGVRIRTQELSESERGVLYSIRDFAHFRRGFYVDLAGGGGYLGLLQQAQGIRNQENNLESLERNLEEHRALAAAGLISLLQRDQVFQQYQESQFSLAQARANYQTNLDSFRIRLGLPTELPARLDEALLKRFELSAPRLDELRRKNEALYLSLLQSDEPPPREQIRKALGEIKGGLESLAEIRKEASGELARWQKRLEDDDADIGETLARQKELAGRLEKSLKESELAAAKNAETVAEWIAKAGEEDADERELWQATQDLASKSFRERLSDVFAAQTQSRVFLIELPPVDITLEKALPLASVTRLDLLNAQARVTDTWRDVEVRANQLQADLTIRYESNLATDPLFDGAFRFDASASRHRVGLQFDAPINRRAERNAYRASQIFYQRARRAWMQTRDEMVREIRLDFRQLELSRRQFEIVREQLIVAARQVEEAEILLRTERQNDSSITLFLLQALNGVLQAKDRLIGSYIDYETARLALYRDLDVMDLDAFGVWTNEPRSASPGALATDLIGDPNGGGDTPDGANPDPGPGGQPRLEPGANSDPERDPDPETRPEPFAPPPPPGPGGGGAGRRGPRRRRDARAREALRRAVRRQGGPHRASDPDQPPDHRHRAREPRKLQDRRRDQ